MNKQEIDTHLLTFIFGTEEPERNIHDGATHSYGVDDQETIHAQYLLEFAREKYSDHPIFQQLNLNYTSVTIAYFLVQMGHVIFFNTSKNKKGGVGKSGFIMMPDELTPSQLNTVTQLSEVIKDYTSFSITDGFYIQDGIINSNTYESTSCLHTKQLIDSYLKKKKVKHELAEKTRK